MSYDTNLVVEKGNFFNMYFAHDNKDSLPVVTVNVKQITGDYCAEAIVDTVVDVLNTHWSEKCW